jgi:hypothetical protein
MQRETAPSLEAILDRVAPDGDVGRMSLGEALDDLIAVIALALTAASFGLVGWALWA